MLQWIKMDPEEYQWAKWASLDIEWFRRDKTYWRSFYKLGKRLKMDVWKHKFVANKSWFMTKYSYTTIWYSCEGIVDFVNATIQEG